MFRSLLWFTFQSLPPRMQCRHSPLRDRARYRAAVRIENPPLAMLTIGDSAPMPVVFDTGTDENILDAALATRAGLEVLSDISTSLDGASGKSLEVPTAATPDPRLSGVPLDTKTVQLLDYRSGDEVGIFGRYVLATGMSSSRRASTA